MGVSGANLLHFLPSLFRVGVDIVYAFFFNPQGVLLDVFVFLNSQGIFGCLMTKFRTRHPYYFTSSFLNIKFSLYALSFKLFFSHRNFLVAFSCLSSLIFYLVFISPFPLFTFLCCTILFSYVPSCASFFRTPCCLPLYFAKVGLERVGSAAAVFCSGLTLKSVHRGPYAPHPPQGDERLRGRCVSLLSALFGDFAPNIIYRERAAIKDPSLLPQIQLYGPNWAARIVTHHQNSQTALEKGS